MQGERGLGRERGMAFYRQDQQDGDSWSQVREEDGGYHVVRTLGVFDGEEIRELTM